MGTTHPSEMLQRLIEAGGTLAQSDFDEEWNEAGDFCFLHELTENTPHSISITDKGRNYVAAMRALRAGGSVMPDRAYAELSLQVGMLAGAADRSLGRSYFVPKVREKAWELTPAYLAKIRQEAIGLGVPEYDLPVRIRREATSPESPKC